MAARDTICALASGPPPSAIAILRISGPGVSWIAAGMVASGLPEPKRASAHAAELASFSISTGNPISVVNS